MIQTFNYQASVGEQISVAGQIYKFDKSGSYEITIADKPGTTVEFIKIEGAPVKRFTLSQFREFANLLEKLHLKKLRKRGKYKK